MNQYDTVSPLSDKSIYGIPFPDSKEKEKAGQSLTIGSFLILFIYYIRF